MEKGEKCIMREMCFGVHYAQSNSSLPLVRGNSVKCSVEQTEGTTVLIDSGLKQQVVCSAERVSDCMTGYALDYVGIHLTLAPPIENGCSRKVIGPKAFYRVHQRELAWFLFWKLPPCLPSWSGNVKWPFKLSFSGVLVRKGLNLIPGFIVNSVNGGYAVAIGGYIAFLPKSLRCVQRVSTHSMPRLRHTTRQGGHRQFMSFFSIVKMNPQIKNIVVRERLVLRPRRGYGRR